MQWSHKRNRKKWKRSDSSDSDSNELMTLFRTQILDFHQVISSLMTLTKTPTSLLVSTKPAFRVFSFKRSAAGAFAVHVKVLSQGVPLRSEKQI